MAQALIGKKKILDFANANPAANISTSFGTLQKGGVQSRGTIDNIIQAVASPFVKATQIGAEGINYLSDTINKGGEYHSKFMDQDDWNSFTRNPILYSGQQAAALASNLILPGGGSVLKQAGKGLLGGGLTSLGSADTDKLARGDFSDIGQGALLGGALGGGIGVLGKGLGKAGNIAGKIPGVNRLGKGLVNAADEAEYGAFVKAVGKPNVKEGGRQLFDNIKKLNLKATDPDALLSGANQIITRDSSKVGQAAKELAGRGVKVNTRDILSPIYQQMDNALLPAQKIPFRRALDQIEAVTKNADVLPIDQVYKLKQEIGELARFTGRDPQSASMAQVLQDTYGRLNGVVDDALQRGGFNEFRQVNQNLTTALRARDLAERQLQNATPSAPMGLVDTAAAAGGLVATGGNPLGAAASVAARRALNSPAAQRAVGNVQRGVGNTLQRVSNVNIPLPQVGGVGQAAGKLLSRPGIYNAVAQSLMNNPNVDQQVLQQFTQSTPEYADGGMGAGMGGVGGIGMMGNPMTQNAMMGGAPTQSGPDRRQIGLALMSQVGVPGSGIRSISDAIALTNFLAPEEKDTGTKEPKPLTEAQSKYVNAASSAQRALQTLKGGGVSTGTGQDVISNIRNIFGGQSTEQTDYMSQLAAARGLAVSALSGANVPPSEYARIANLIPEITDHPEIAERKLQNFVMEMQSFAGFDPTSGQRYDMNYVTPLGGY